MNAVVWYLWSAAVAELPRLIFCLPQHRQLSRMELCRPFDAPQCVWQNNILVACWGMWWASSCWLWLMNCVYSAPMNEYDVTPHLGFPQFPLSSRVDFFPFSVDSGLVCFVLPNINFFRKESVEQWVIKILVPFHVISFPVEILNDVCNFTILIELKDS